jgi:hypothetical protein
MERNHSYLMGGCPVMALGREHPPTFITPTPVPSSCNRKQTSLGANDECAHPLLDHPLAACRAVAAAGPDRRQGCAALWGAPKASVKENRE